MPVVRLLLIVGLAAVAGAACSTAGSAPTPAPTLWVSTPNGPCAGAEKPALRITIDADLSTWGTDVLVGSSAIPGRYRLVWPPGYGARETAAGWELVDEHGRPVAHDGTVLYRWQVCVEDDNTLVLTGPAPSLSP